MTDRDMIKALGGSTAVAAALGVARQRVVNWSHPKRKIPPEWRGPIIELAHQRGVKVDWDFLRLPENLLQAVKTRLVAESRRPAA